MFGDLVSFPDLHQGHPSSFDPQPEHFGSRRHVPFPPVIQRVDLWDFGRGLLGFASGG